MFPYPTCDLKLIAEEENDSIDDNEVRALYSQCRDTCDAELMAVGTYFECVGEFNLGKAYDIPTCPLALKEARPEQYDLCVADCESKADTYTMTEYYQCIKKTANGGKFDAIKDMLPFKKDKKD